MKNQDRRYALLLNKRSDSGRAFKTFKKSEDNIRAILGNFDLFDIDQDTNLSELSKSISDTYDVIIACGGDGTVSSTASGLINTDCQLAVLPLGSGNDFAKMIGFHKISLLEQLSLIKEGNIRTVDTIKIDDQICVNTFGIGFTGYTNYLASKSRFKKSFKYIISGLRSLTSCEEFDAKILINDSYINCSTLLLIIANGKWEGSKYKVSEFSDHSDGVFEFHILKNIKRYRLAFEFIKLSLGYPLNKNLVDTYQLKSLKIQTSRPLYGHSDGEVVEPVHTFEINILPASLKVITA